MLWFHKLLAKIGIRTETYRVHKYLELCRICEKIQKNQTYGFFGDSIRPKQVLEQSMDEVKRGEEK